jgi:hypothetical protein
MVRTSVMRFDCNGTYQCTAFWLQWYVLVYCILIAMVHTNVCILIAMVRTSVCNVSLNFFSINLELVNVVLTFVLRLTSVKLKAWFSCSIRAFWQGTEKMWLEVPCGAHVTASHRLYYNVVWHCIMNTGTLCCRMAVLTRPTAEINNTAYIKTRSYGNPTEPERTVL